MKRFYCTVSKKLKRVLQYPANVKDTSAKLPQDRVGECKWHANSDFMTRKASA